MQIFFIIALVIVVLLFGLTSISQSYAASQQAQAAIEASRAAQIASAGNLVIIATLAVLLLVAVGVIALLLLRAKSQPKRQWTPGSNADWEPFPHFPQPNPNALLPTLLTMMMYQMMQQHQHEIEQFWMSEPHQDVPAIPDNTWEL